jgi:HEAT repeat protein
MREMAKDADAKVRARAVKALGQTGQEKARPLLESALLDPDANVRQAAAVCLNRPVPDAPPPAPGQSAVEAF